MLKSYGVVGSGGGGLQDFSVSPGSWSQSQSKRMREPEIASERAWA